MELVVSKSHTTGTASQENKNSTQESSILPLSSYELDSESHSLKWQPVWAIIYYPRLPFKNNITVMKTKNVCHFDDVDREEGMIL